jgi:predicted O-methyltransferase YrrM
MDNSKINEVLKDEKHYPIISYDVAVLIITEVKAHHCQNVLEIGGCVGFSALNLILAMGDEGQVTTIEVTPERAEILRANMIAAGVSQRVKVLEGDAKNIIPTLADRFDCVFIDAMKREYLSYLMLAEDKLSPGCLIIADNVQSHADKMQDFLHYITTSTKYTAQIHNIGAGVLIAKRE